MNLRQIKRSSHMIRKQRKALQAYKGMAAEVIPKPRLMLTRDYERRKRILIKHERLLREALRGYIK